MQALIDANPLGHSEVWCKYHENLMSDVFAHRLRCLIRASLGLVPTFVYAMSWNAHLNSEGGSMSTVDLLELTG